jgi:hypothetical protein
MSRFKRKKNFFGSTSMLFRRQCVMPRSQTKSELEIIKSPTNGEVRDICAPRLCHGYRKNDPSPQTSDISKIIQRHSWHARKKARVVH